MGHARRAALVCAAGEAAQLLACPGGETERGCSQDREDAAEFTGDWPGAVREAREFLLRPLVWRHVEALGETPGPCCVWWDAGLQVGALAG